MALHLKGSMVAIVTPFLQDGSVDFDRLGSLIDWHIAEGTDGIVTLGTTGESSTMTHEEDAEVCEFTVKRVAGRIPVIAGSGSNCTQTMLEKSQTYEKLGADGLLIISPYYNKANTQGMIKHFTTVADGVNLPCILYNVPGRTGCSIPIEAIPTLAAHPNIAGIKEASGNISYAAQVAKYLSDDFVMYSGNDDMIVPILSLGGSGVISVFANIAPRQAHDIVASFHAGDIEKSRKLQIEYLDLINDLFIEVNPIPVKEALAMMGRIELNYRLPLCEMTQAHRDVLRKEMERMSLL